ISGLSKTSLTALVRALAPSRTARIGLVTSRPRSRSPVIRPVTRVAVSVEPSSTARGGFVPSVPVPRGPTPGGSPKGTPSTLHGTRVRVTEPAGHQLRRRGLGRGDEPARHRRLARGHRALFHYLPGGL